MSAASPAATRELKGTAKLLQSNTYTIFILVMTIYSLIIMAIQMFLTITKPNSPTWQLVNLYDNLICLIFLFDFALHMIHTPVKRDYFIGERGYFDLLGSIPSFGFGVFQYAALLRLFRLSRLMRLRRVLNPKNRELLRKEILENRGQYALFITILMALIVITAASILVLFFESPSPDANITNGGDAVWWAMVTITTVGYGDRFPVTAGGRLVGVIVMFSGVGIIGALASILASILVPQPKEEKPTEEEPKGVPAASSNGVEQELAAVKEQLAALRQLIESRPQRE